MRFQALCSVSVVALSALVGAATAYADPKGLWLAQDGAKVRVAPCGKGLCGKIAVTKSPTNPDTGRPWTDMNNFDSQLRDRPLLGVEVFIDMMPDGPGKWSGELYDTGSGRNVPGHLYDVDAKTLRVEGCAGLNGGPPCGGQNLTRLE
jgi:uncharacterized protein (DUF2147 family)